MDDLLKHYWVEKHSHLTLKVMKQVMVVFMD